MNFLNRSVVMRSFLFCCICFIIILQSKRYLPQRKTIMKRKMMTQINFLLAISFFSTNQNQSHSRKWKIINQDIQIKHQHLRLIVISVLPYTYLFLTEAQASPFESSLFCPSLFSSEIPYSHSSLIKTHFSSPQQLVSEKESPSSNCEIQA